MPQMPKTDNYDRPKFKRERTRKTSHKRGYTKKWAQARLRWLAKHPFCVECLKKGKLNDGTPKRQNHVDHIIPHKGNMQLFWDTSNWQTLCQKHHNQKTAKGE